MQSSPEALPQQLIGKPLLPAYLICGQEPLRVLEAADAVRTAARAQGVSEREVFAADGNQREPDWAGLAASFRAPGLFSSRRLLELRLPSGKPGKEGAASIVEFCADPPGDVCLLVVCDDWGRQHGGKWSEAIAKIGLVVVAWAIKPHELSDWIDRRLRDRGLTADRAAVQRLAERVEGNLLAAAQEIDKLVLLSDGEVLDVERMDALVADSARYDVFRLIDAAMNGNAAQVSRMLHGLRAEGIAVSALLGMVTMELQRAAALSRVQARGGNLGAEFKAQRIWDSKQATYRRALQRHAAPRWERLVAEAGKVDRIAKGRPRIGSEPSDAWQSLERLLLAVADSRALALLA